MITLVAKQVRSDVVPLLEPEAVALYEREMRMLEGYDASNEDVHRVVQGMATLSAAISLKRLAGTVSQD